MQRKLVVLLVVLVGLPVIVSACVSILGGASSFLVFILKHPTWFFVILALLVFTIIGVCLYTVKQNYSPLSSDSKSAFWQILTNIFLVFFTFWMGIFVQDLIASKNESVNKKMVTFEYVDRISNNYKTILYSDIVSELGVYADISNVYSQKLRDDSLKLENDMSYADTCIIDHKIKQRCDFMLIQYMIEQKKEIVALSKTHDSIMADYKYYLDQQMFDSISNMNRTRILLIAVADLIEDSTLLNSVPHSVIVETHNITDTLNHSKILAYFENILKSPYMLYSGNPSQNYYKMAELGCQLYTLSKKADFYQMHILQRLAMYLVTDGQIMMGEMSAQRASSSDPLFAIFKPILGGPIRTFIIFLLLTFIVSAIIIRVISPRRVKPVVAKDRYDELSKKCDDLNAIIRLREIELNRKRKECKDADSLNKELQKGIHDRDKKIADLEGIIHD